MSCIINGELYRSRREALQDFDGDGFTMEDGDCNDDNSAIKPTAQEVCDWIDNDCNGMVDDLAELPLWFRDQDGDGFGDAGRSFEACFPDGGAVEVAGDCDDADPNIHPDMLEEWSNAFVDNNCDTVLDGTSLWIEDWKPFANLSFRGSWHEGGAALMLKDEGTVYAETHWLRAIDVGISLTPLFPAHDARQSPTGAVLIQPILSPNQIVRYEPIDSEDIKSTFIFSNTVLDMEVIGDSDGDGINDLLAYFQNTITTDLSHHVVITPQEGYARVEVTQFEFEFSSTSLDLDGDYQPIGDWDGDGRSDFVLHHAHQPVVDVYTPFNDFSLGAPNGHFEAQCTRIFGLVSPIDEPWIGCFKSDEVLFYGTDSEIVFTVFPPSGGELQDVTPLDLNEGGLAVLYRLPDADAAIALIHPDVLLSSDGYQIQGTEPHIYSEAIFSGLQYLGPIRDGANSSEVLVSHLSASEDWVGLFAVPELLE